MKTVEAKCKFCGGKLQLRIDPECPDDWTQKLVPLAACNRCVDWIHARDKAQAALLACAVHISLGHKPDEKMMALLEGITRKLASALAKYQRQPQSAWTPDFPKAIADKPDKWFDTFMAFVRGARLQPQMEFRPRSADA